MGTLTVRFVGVQAYVPLPNPAGTGSTLRVYMPNGTKLGKSDQGAPPRHMPMVWRENNEGRLIHTDHLRQFPWFRAVLKWEPEDGASLTPLDLTDFPAETNDETKRLRLSRSRLADPRRLAGIVEIDKGDDLRLYGPEADSSKKKKGECRLKGWSVKPAPVGLLSLFSKLEIKIQHVKKATVRFTHIAYENPFDPEIDPPEDIDILEPDRNEPLLFGNVCAETLLRWPQNRETGVEDRDFEWIYQLVDPRRRRSLPVMSHNGGAFTAKDSYGEIAAEISDGGGGGSGCQCQGCTGDEGG